jgi:hypothetical protein
MAEDPMTEIERELFGEMTTKQKAQRVLDLQAGMAAQTLVELAIGSPNDRIRLSAAEAILNRTLGPVGKEEQQDVLDDFMKGMQALAKIDKQPKQG